MLKLPFRTSEPLAFCPRRIDRRAAGVYRMARTQRLLGR